MWRGLSLLSLVAGCAGCAAIDGDGRPRAQTVTCESIDERRSTCGIPEDTNGLRTVSLRRQLSETDCDRNDNWGVEDDAIWVDDGCRGEFVVRFDGDEDDAFGDNDRPGDFNEALATIFGGLGGGVIGAGVSSDDLNDDERRAVRACDDEAEGVLRERNDANEARIVRLADIDDGGDERYRLEGTVEADFGADERRYDFVCEVDDGDVERFVYR